MREDFVSFLLAKRLKKKGFNKNCLGLYVISTKRLVYNVSNHAGEDFTYLLSRRDNDVCIEAPTIYQVLKWLREEKEIDVNILPTYSGVYCVGIYKKFHRVETVSFNCFYCRYESAVLAGINYVLDNLI